MPTAQAADQLAAETYQQLVHDFPHLEPLLRSIQTDKFDYLHVAPITASEQTQQLTTEESHAIIQKLQQIVDLPGSTIENETLLYIEQQLSEVLGFEVSTGNDQFQLPFQKATLFSLPHLFFSPTLQAATIKNIPEAGIAKARPIFGWQLAGTAPTVSDYWIALSLRSLATQPLSITQLKQLLTKKKFCLINPQQELYCIVELIDDFLDPANRYQLGASPQLVREGQFWSPVTLGRTVIFYLNDQSNSLKPGCYQIGHQPS
ncbi:MAG: hypothetical protein COY81_00055 [Candidatus Pacebacteria bacterium CG_4_10_14_0_8_um_filter_43_12]|nr:MAG: hypothetical protein COU66_00385 [Candidatus Pacebacteria bacterium CG10_big_fil_rev_8_21_14_0_10_44_11]PIY79869.1 MAG: hypothetical protein COY81_00055 [Candidatus Pacebacteria bacterium CG_4_10_14_0_8_um_filter_43_12]